MFWALAPDPNLPLQGTEEAAIVGQERGGRGQVLGVTGGWGASRGELKRTHPKEVVTWAKASSPRAAFTIPSDFIYKTNSNIKQRISRQQHQSTKTPAECYGQGPRSQPQFIKPQGLCSLLKCIYCNWRIESLARLLYKDDSQICCISYLYFIELNASKHTNKWIHIKLGKSE